jgi:hypothetical protein
MTNLYGYAVVYLRRVTSKSRRGNSTSPLSFLLPPPSLIPSPIPFSHLRHTASVLFITSWRRSVSFLARKGVELLAVYIWGKAIQHWPRLCASKRCSSDHRLLLVRARTGLALQEPLELSSSPLFGSSTFSNARNPDANEAIGCSTSSRTTSPYIRSLFEFY